MRSSNDSFSNSYAGLAASSAIALGPGLAFQGSAAHFRRNEEIFGQGEPANYVYRVVSGAVRTVRFTSDGRRQIMAFHFPGDVFGIETDSCHCMSAEAIADAEVSVVRRALIERAVSEDAGAACALMRLISRQLEATREHTLVLGRKGADERVASFLLELAARMPGPELELPMSRADIADYLALTIETVSRAFTQMERSRTISLPSSRHVVLRDKGALEQRQAA